MPLPFKSRRRQSNASFHEQAIDLANITAGSVDVTNTVKIPGAVPGDAVIVNCNNVTNALIFDAYVSSDNTVTLIAKNGTAGAINAASATFWFCVFHRK
jgi:hypothetical protein